MNVCKSDPLPSQLCSILQISAMDSMDVDAGAVTGPSSGSGVPSVSPGGIASLDTAVGLSSPSSGSAASNGAKKKKRGAQLERRLRKKARDLSRPLAPMFRPEVQGYL